MKQHEVVLVEGWMDLGFFVLFLGVLLGILLGVLVCFFWYFFAFGNCLLFMVFLYLILGQ